MTYPTFGFLDLDVLNEWTVIKNNVSFMQTSKSSYV